MSNKVVKKLSLHGSGSSSLIKFDHFRAVLCAGVPDVAGRAERAGGELRRAEELPRAELRRGAGRRHRQAQAPPRPLLAPGRGIVI